jgi:hypothetical protein
MAVPYTFGTATAAIPLSQLDTNFATAITIGNTAVQLGNTVTTLNNMTLANVTISSGNVTLTNVSVTTANVSTANIVNSIITTGETLSYGTANGVAYLNGSKVLTTGSALVFDGTKFGVGASSPIEKIQSSSGIAATGANLSVGSLDGFVADYSSGVSRLFASRNGVASGSLAFWTTDSTGTAAERMRLDSSGNLGLGVTPSAWTRKALQLGDAAAAYVANNSGGATVLATNMYFDGSNKYATSAAAARYSVGLGSHEWYTAASGTAGNAITFTQAMTLDASGNLGVGQTSPTAKLDIVSTNATTAVFRDTSRYALVSIQAGGTNQSSYLDMAPTGTGAAIFQVSSTERMRIDSSGNLLVGTTSNNASSGRVQIKFDGSTLNGLNLQTTYASTGSYYLIFNNSAGSTTGYISQNGTTTVAYNTSSDYRLKNNIAPMTGALAKVALLKPCTYKWNSDGSDGQGFIAHELQEVVPECVTGEKDAMDEEGNPKYQGIDTSFLVATLTAAIQELKAEFDAYKATHP